MKRFALYFFIIIVSLAGGFGLGRKHEPLRAAMASMIPGGGFDFEMPGPDGPITWTTSGPVSGLAEASVPQLKRAQTPDGEFSFKVEGKKGLAVLDTKTGKTEYYRLPPNFPAFSWAEAIAYSPDHNLVVVGSQGGEGFIYRFDFTARRWQDFRSMNNILDIKSLVYDPFTQHFLGLSSMPGCVFEMTNDGKPVRLYSLAPVYKAGSQMDHEMSGICLVPHDHRFVLMTFKRGRSVGGGMLQEVAGLWVVDRSDMSTTRTY